MESFRPQKSPSSDRFLGILSTSPPSPSSTSSSPSFELDELDIFSTDTNPNPNFPNQKNPNPNFPNQNPNPRSRSSPLSPFRNFGILAALPEESTAKFLRRKPSSSTIPIAPVKVSSGSDPLRIRNQSAPVSVPMGSRRKVVLVEEVEEDEEEMMLPPHEIVDRANGKGEPMTTFSVLEGAGRTLKGRDLRRVRNAVWRRTGFLD